MAIVLVGSDPKSYGGQSPAVLVDTDRRELVLQSWKGEAPLLAEVARCYAPLPGHETVIRMPHRMIPFLRRALDELEALGEPDADSAGGP